MPGPAAAQAVTGAGQMIAGAATYPMLHFVIQPGRWRYEKRKNDKGKYVRGPRYFEPNPRFPEGVRFSIPSWFVLIVGLPVIIYAIGGIDKVLSGIEPNEKEEVSMWDAARAGAAVATGGISEVILALT